MTFFPNALSACSQTLFRRLHEQLNWGQYQVRVFGRVHPTPRLQAWHGDPGTDYGYAGLRLTPAPWTGDLTAVRAAINRLLHAQFNAVLANLYRDGTDHMGWHADDEPELGPQPMIASLSFGAERRFLLRHRKSKQQIELNLSCGSLLVMGGALQAHWQHRVPKAARIPHPRINLTFRTIEPA